MKKRIFTALFFVLTVSLFVAEKTSAHKNEPAISKAIEKSLTLLDGVRLPFLEKTGCFSCHHNSLPAMAVGSARERGFKVNEQTSTEESKQILELVNAGREKVLQGDSFGGAHYTAALVLMGLSANKQPPNRTTDALAIYLLSRQSADGRWASPGSRPPSESSDFTSTAIAIRALQLYAPKGLQPEMAARAQRAHTWLIKAVPQTNEDRTFQLLGLAWANADKQRLQKLAQALLSEQRKDGGWSQYSTMTSDAYATGQALVALHQAGGLSVTDPTYQRGVNYLLDNQAADGSWEVKAHTLRLQRYFESGFPYGHNQWISTAATSWATMALILATE